MALVADTYRHSCMVHAEWHDCPDCGDCNRHIIVCWLCGRELGGHGAFGSD